MGVAVFGWVLQKTAELCKCHIRKCGNGSYYVGHTHDSTERYARHVNKSGVRHTAQNPVEFMLPREDSGETSQYLAAD